MCGIAGAVVRQEGGFDRATLARMLETIAHRGPDGEGMAEIAGPEGARVFLGHRRLAIIDPVGAAQPMRDAARGLTLTFNGEIYNFRELRRELEARGHAFARDSDTEVLLHAYAEWGERAVERLRGMFAFAVWDAREAKLFLARDRFGEKPLFVREERGTLCFASEIKALLVPAGRPAVDESAVWDYLAFRYVPGPKTLLAGIRKLAPGTCATWKDGRVTERRYWTAPDRGPSPAPSPKREGDLIEEFLLNLDRAVELQMVSDVPFGAFLSGGLDSSTIVALMTRHNAKVKTFSVGFGGKESAYSELRYAGVVAKHFATDHHELVVDPEHLMAHLPRLVAYRDAPVTEPSDIPIYMLAKEASKSVKMVLTGEGSDELLGGYPKHVFERFAGVYQGVVPGAIRHNLIQPLARSLPYGFRRVKTAITNLNLDDWRERYPRWFGACSNAERASLTTLRVNGHAFGGFVPPFDADPGASALRRILYADQTSWLPDNLLERGDRMTMAASIESRVPFLDHELAAFVSALPDRCRVRGFTTKWILRRAAAKLLPAAILERPKVGFRVPVNRWFQGPMREFVFDHLRGADSRTRAYYDAAVLDRMLDEHVHGRQNHEKLIWALLNLEIWQRQYA
jgi:asparagine synthase (glutamine-hydrolysing)